MEWNFQWGKQLKKLLEIEANTGITPRALLDAPRLDGIAQEIVTAYNVLASRRTAGFGMNPIPLSEISAFISLFGPPSMELMTFIELIGIMDIKFLELSNGDKPTS